MPSIKAYVFVTSLGKKEKGENSRLIKIKYKVSVKFSEFCDVQVLQGRCIVWRLHSALVGSR